MSDNTVAIAASVQLKLNTQIYPKKVVETAAYYMEGEVEIRIAKGDDNSLVVDLTTVDKSRSEWQLKRDFYRELTTAFANLRVFREANDLRRAFVRSAYYNTEEGRKEIETYADQVDQNDPGTDSVAKDPEQPEEKTDDGDMEVITQEASAAPTNRPKRASVELSRFKNPALRPDIHMEAAFNGVREIDSKKMLEIYVNPERHSQPTLISLVAEIREACDQILLETRSRGKYLVWLRSDSVNTMHLGQEFIELLICRKYER